MIKKFSSIKKAAIVFLGTALSASALAMTGGGSGGGAGGLDQYGRDGSEATTQQSLGFGCTVYRPRSLNGNPVIIWGNGTGSRPSTYAGLLRHWASWGFVVVAADTSNAGTGRDMIDCLDAIYRSEGSNLTDKVGTSGHSQGGGGSIMAGRDSRVDATAPIQPYTLGLGHSSSSQSRQNGPMLLLSGSSDTLAGPTLNQSPVYGRINTPVFWATRRGASHFEPVGSGGDFQAITTAWFLYQLKGDSNAASLFQGSSCGLCNTTGWEVRSKGL